MTKFNSSCQTSIDSKLLARRCKLSKQELETIEKLDGGFQIICPFLSYIGNRTSRKLVINRKHD